jgi:hypothetical protein
MTASKGGTTLLSAYGLCHVRPDTTFVIFVKAGSTVAPLALLTAEKRYSRLLGMKFVFFN